VASAAEDRAEVPHVDPGVGVKLDAHFDLRRVDAELEERMPLVRRRIAEHVAERALLLDETCKLEPGRRIAPEEDPLAVHPSAVAQARLLVRGRYVDQDAELGQARHDPLGPRQHPLFERSARLGMRARRRPFRQIGVEVDACESERFSDGRRGHCSVGGVEGGALRPRTEPGRRSVSFHPRSVNRAAGALTPSLTAYTAMSERG
jgi:hypothetical protein